MMYMGGSKRDRQEKELARLQADWDLRNKKLANLNRELILDAGGSRKFELTEKIDAEEIEIKLLTQKITKIEADLGYSHPVNIDKLVEQLRAQVKADIEERCGTMRVLDMNQPIATNSIYTQVNILEKISGKTRAEIDQLMEGCNPEDFDRFFLGNVRQKRVDGLEALDQQKLLMILGKPGAGKTTFLKRLAMLCNCGERFSEHVPLFVTLNEFADRTDRLNLIEFISQSVNQPAEMLVSILSSGRGLVLLDGLDEVQEAEHDRVLAEIRDFGRRYYQNRIIITCRIAAREYIFEQFTEVEVADFNDTQIKDFVTKWFAQKDPVKSEEFIKQIEINKPVKELATNPLLLTMLCLDFEGSGNFPKSRGDLYESGLNELLVKWDGRRNIRRFEVYKNLSVKRKKSLLGQLAMATFENGEYFFKQAQVESQISQYIENLPNADSNPEALLVNSHALLKMIESQHGLLTERAKGIYSFSHLTFHEYFTATQILANSSHTTQICALDQLLTHITEKRWREVFLLVVEGLENGDYFICKMKRNIDLLLSSDIKLQNFLSWVKVKSSSVSVKYKPSAIRAYYYSLELALDSSHADAVTLRHHRDRTLSLENARILAHAVDLDQNFDLATTLDLKLTPLLIYGLSSPFERDRSLALVLALIFALAIARAHDRDIAQDLVQKLNTAISLNIGLKRKLQNLKSEILDSSKKAYKDFKEWWSENGKRLASQIRQSVIDHRNIGHDWKLSLGQRQKLRQYYEANKLLIDCLKSDCYVSRAVREEIEATLLLPLADIEAYRQQQ